MKQFKLSVSSRNAQGSLAAGRLRRSGQVPGVIYGRKTTARSIAVDDKSMRKLLREVGDSIAVIEVDEGGKSVLALVQEVKRHATKDHLMHIDFHEISPEDPLHIHVPIHVVGEPEGVTVGGGLLNVVLHKIDIKALPKHLPSSVDVNIAHLQIGDAIHVKELPQLEGVSYLAEADAVVVACSAPLVAEEVPAVEAAAESAGSTPAKSAKPAAKKK